MILATISQVKRLDVGPIGRRRIGHDRGRIRVDQHDLVAFFAQGFAGLRAGIVEFTGLTDDDRAGADEQNAVNVVASWHGRARLRIAECGMIRRPIAASQRLAGHLRWQSPGDGPQARGPIGGVALPKAKTAQDYRGGERPFKGHVLE